MKKVLVALVSSTLILGCSLFYLKSINRLPFGLSQNAETDDNGEDEGESRIEKYRQEFEQMKDPALGRIPSERLLIANETTEELKQLALSSRVNALSWTERGPIYDSTGPSNGNTRGGSSYTSGMIPAFLVDTLNDPTGNTVFIGSSGGGLWKCTNFLSVSAPNWIPINDFMANLGIASICQHPSSPNIMYMATGDGNTLDVRGYGVWKSTNAGTTWTLLPSTTTFRYGFKVLCDAAGIVYFASGGNGLQRSSDGGSTWQDISPAGNTASNSSYVPDLELSSTGRMHASFGYLGTAVTHYYTDIPATVTSGAGWNLSTGIRNSGVSCRRLELAVQGNVLYGLTVNGSNITDSSYKSTDGGATWTKQNATIYPSALGNGQGYYNITLNINPDNSNEFIAGGIDAYRSINSGVSLSLITNWVSVAPYVHADHHFIQWWKVGTESRVIIASDGGMFLSRDGGVTWRDRNENLGIKQFYSAAIHPTAGTDYFLGGAQDNGSHKLAQPGRSYSQEVTGGDGAFVHINQQTPAVQYTSYVFNQYRRSVDGGTTWAQVNLSGQGYFINPFDYDDAQNIMYSSYAISSAPTNAIVRWPNANTAGSASAITIPALERNAANSNASAFKVSPYTANKLFIGGSTGKLLMVENSNTVTSATVMAFVTNLTGASFPSGYLRCINTGTSDQYLVATFTNYGVDNIWSSTDGGSTWTAIDGNLPDMPVWWAVFEPGTDNRLIIATETGVFTTQNINGASTVWTPNYDFPTVRTTMLKVRASDKTVVASTYGRGIFTTVIPTSTNPEINFTTPSTNAKEDALITNGCRRYRDYLINLSLVDPPTGAATVTYSIQAGASAVLGKDYDFTTNGDFTTPSSQHVFANNETGVKQLTVRVYDDAQVETNNSFTLTYAVSGATNAVAGAVNKHTFNITDNDVPPTNSVSTYQVGGAYNGNITDNLCAFASNYLKNRVQYLFYASELKAAGIHSGGTISALTLRVATKNSTRDFLGFTISMAHTGNVQVSTGYAPEARTTVFSANYSSVLGDNVFNFTTPFIWDGVSNVVVQFCFDNNAYGTAEAASDIVEGNSQPLPAAFRASVMSNTNTGTGCSLAAAQISYFRANASFTINLDKQVSTVLNNTQTEYLNGNSDLYYYDAIGNIMARVKNLSGHNYGCTQLTIDRAGVGATAFTNSTPANYLSNKTFNVVPTTPNTSGQYEITLYYTAAEKAGWEAATGNTWSNVKLVKVKGQIKDYTPSIPQPYGPGTVESVTPVHGTHGTDYTLTYTFNTGFSGFAAGIPSLTVLPVTLLHFKGELQGKSTLLSWATTMEMNSKNFEIEKSTDGINYYRIATVNAAGNSSARRDYSLKDNKLTPVNYYRLKMNDLDGKSKYSQIVVIRYAGVLQSLWVVNNPFNNYIDIRLATKPKSVKLQLITSNGSLVAEKTVSGSEQIRWDLPNQNLSRGTYILKAWVDGEVLTEKLIRQ